MKLKKGMALILSALVLSASVGVTATAAEASSMSNELVAPAYEIANQTVSSLVISSRNASCMSSCTGFSTVVRIDVEQTLQKHWGLWVWNDVDNASWTTSKNSSHVALSNSKSGLEGGTYRLKSVFTLTDSNGETETITVYSTEEDVP